MDHNEIRFRVLCRLYEKYWKDSGQSLVNTNGLIEELNLDLDSDVIYKNVIYLHEKNLISGEKIIGSNPLPAVKINTNGIDLVERCMRRTLDNTQNDEIKEKLSSIISDPDKSSRIKKFFDLTKSYSPLIGNVISVVSMILT